MIRGSDEERAAVMKVEANLIIDSNEQSVEFLDSYFSSLFI